MHFPKWYQMAVVISSIVLIQHNETQMSVFPSFLSENLSRYNINDVLILFVAMLFLI